MDKILIIDSSKLTPELLLKQFSRIGYDAILIDSSKGLSIRLATVKPDLILINTSLKTESGFDICKKIKSLDEAEYVPIMMIGDSYSNNDLIMSLESGADDYLSKEHSALILMSKIASLLRLKKLSDQLRNQYTEIEEKNKILDSQLKMAMQVQRSLIRDYDFKHGSTSFYSRYLPALDVGGDYYDIIKINDDLISIIMCDVSGHGISAALLTSMIHTITHNLIVEYIDPSKFLCKMNEEFISIFENRSSSIYVCVFYAIINVRKRTIKYSNAGQVLPIHVHKKGKTALELMALGTPIGMLEGSVYENFEAEFSEGDSFLFFTDGLCDNFFKNNTEEFINQLKELLVDMNERHSPKSILNAILELSGLTSFEKEYMKYQLDDISLILVKV